MDAYPKNIFEAVSLEYQGKDPSLYFFYGHNTSVGSACLSQWYSSPFVVRGETFFTAEHYMMVHKARLFNDEATAQRILNTENPRDAKKLGRRVCDFNENYWETYRYNIVVRGNLAKFTQHPYLADFLLFTRGRLLVEASPYDTIWGIGLSAGDPRAAQPSTWRGQNLLGFALTDVRTRLDLGD